MVQQGQNSLALRSDLGEGGTASNGHQSGRQPPTPLQPSRFMICTDDDFGDTKAVTPKTEPPEESSSSSDKSSTSMDIKIESSQDDTSSTRVKSESRCLSPVGLMARDPDGPSSHEIVVGSDIVMLKFMNMGPLTSDQMNAPPWVGNDVGLLWMEISQLNQHDKMIQVGLGLTSNSNSGPKTVVFTSHPLVFLQESGDAVVDVIDVGAGASHLNSVGGPKDWCKLIEGYHNIVFAIGYETPGDPLMHGAFLAEVESACELDGSIFFAP